MIGDEIDGLVYKINNSITTACHLSLDDLKNQQHKLPVEEEKYLPNLSQRRRKEFVAGRNIARLAIKTLKPEAKNTIILKLDDGQPSWPAGIVGSISHKLNLVGAFVGDKKLYHSLGFDIEKVESLEPRTWKYFSSIEEIKTAKLLGLDDSVFANTLFSIKESIFKCLYPLYVHKTPEMRMLKPEVRRSSEGFMATIKCFNTECRVRTLVSSSAILSLAYVPWEINQNKNV